MADLVITAASVLKGTDAKTEVGTAGAAVTAGQTVYKDPTDNKFRLADANDGNSAVRTVYGIALCNAAAGQPLVVQKSGDITLGAVLTVGLVYVQSTTPGAIAPVADLAAGNYTTFIGAAKSTSVLKMGISSPGVSV